ncbi:methyl-accepting chemotaxis protein [Parageobacillus thermoglucosidasius]|uniref:methyl-accepting chemotaxis protein n=1 Tax=Parageobacillus thermoglucosidasius TaxID=1426 RepID=UPI0001D1756E|nr:methyl-accepting chemotaxis protein [Parageobacillus thermoglucosidasius]AEH47213.1 methyl-accepting chemotaxis sensory transducer [Parageobacillus thermoglucosidasius C56-YS93]
MKRQKRAWPKLLSFPAKISALRFTPLSWISNWNLQTILLLIIVLITCISSAITASIGYEKNKQVVIRSIEQQMQMSTEVMVEKISMLKSSTTNEEFNKKFLYVLALNQRKFQSLGLRPLQFVITSEKKVEHLGNFSSQLPSLPPSVIKQIEKRQQGMIHFQGWTLSFARSIDLNGQIYVLALAEEDYLRPVAEYGWMSILVSLLTILLTSFIGFLLIRRFTQPIASLKQAMNEVGQGNLRTKIKLAYSSKDIRTLADGFNQMVDSLTTLIEHIDASSKHITASSHTLRRISSETKKSSEQIAIAMGETASGTEKQASSSIKISQFFHEIADGMGQAAASISGVEASTSKVSEQAHAGNELANQTVKQMRVVQKTVGETAEVIYLLGEQSKQIGQIVSLISNIANQTNLLSLNAAIEAARAGEHGKGFSVVANEIRKLASQTSLASQQIQTIIKEIQHEVERAVQSMARGSQVLESGMEMVYQTEAAFKGIVDAVNNVSQQSKEVSAVVHDVNVQTKQMSASMEEIASIAQQIAGNMEHVAAVTRRQSSSMDEVLHASQSLTKLVGQLNSLLQTFKV